MHILSFDIGIKNLAYCYTEDYVIKGWDVIDISAKTVSEVCERCVESLHSRFAALPIDKVLIENQPVQKNPTMKTIQIVVYTYFLRSKVVDNSIQSILFVSASKKNKLAERFNISVECKTKYLRAKKLSILCVKHILHYSDQVHHWTDHFAKHKKKDDLADSYMQLLAHLNYEPVLPNPPEPLSVSESESTSNTSQSAILESSS